MKQGEAVEARKERRKEERRTSRDGDALAIHLTRLSPSLDYCYCYCAALLSPPIVSLSLATF